MEKKTEKIFKDCETTSKGVTYTQGKYQKEKRKKKSRKNIWNNGDWEFSQTNVRHQTTYQGSSENTKKDKWQQQKH